MLSLSHWPKLPLLLLFTRPDRRATPIASSLSLVFRAQTHGAALASRAFGLKLLSRVESVCLQPCAACSWSTRRCHVPVAGVNSLSLSPSLEPTAASMHALSRPYATSDFSLLLPCLPPWLARALGCGAYTLPCYILALFMESFPPRPESFLSRLIHTHTYVVLAPTIRILRVPWYQLFASR